MTKAFMVLGGENSTNASASADGASTKIYLGDAAGRGGADLRAVGAQVKTKVYLGAPTGPAIARDLPTVGRQVGSRSLRILLSYHYYKDEDLDALLSSCFGDLGIELDVFADSGAYSAYTCGQPIDVVAYIAWVNRWKHWFKAVAGPDAIGDPVASTSATEKMLGEVVGVPVLPTFHVGEDWKWLDYWQSKVDYMAFGGMVPYTRQRPLLTAWLKKAFARLVPGMRVHGFGLTTWPLLLAYPWYSVDSSSWTAGFRYAQLYLFDQRRGRMVEVKMGQRQSILTNIKLLAEYNLRPSQVLASGYDRDLLCGACIESWQRAEEWLTQRRIYLCASLPDGRGGARANGTGTKTFLSCGSSVSDPKHSTSHASAVGRGVKTYLSCGSVPIDGAPNRPEGIARGRARYLLKSSPEES